MIFVTVGMHHQGFDRLIKGMDQAAQALTEPVIMQIGSSEYQPLHAADWFRFADQEQILELCAQARIIIGHAGAGTIITALRLPKPLIIVPRRPQYQEIIDNHQFELITALAQMKKVVAVEDPTDSALLDAISSAEHLKLNTRGHNTLADAVKELLAGSEPAAAGKP